MGSKLFLVAILFPLIGDIQCYPAEALLDQMTEPEIVYYFRTSDRRSLPDYEVIYLPVVLPSREAFGESKINEEIGYNFSAFNKPINLKLRTNQHIVSPNLKTYINENDNYIKITNPEANCHYLHKDDKIVAAMSICQPQAIQGMIFLEDETLEIHPLTKRLGALIQSESREQENFINGDRFPHIIKKASIPPDLSPIDFQYNHTNNNIFNGIPSIEESLMKRGTSGMTLEVALFFDEAAYNIFAPFFNNNEKELMDMLLAYLNGVQALYHHPSIGATLDIVLVRLDILKNQPYLLPHYNGERGKLLDSFCDYQNSINPAEDSNPDHWDMGLYVSGLDFFAYENGRKSGATMGLAPVGGVCLNKFNCVISEFGTMNILGKPYPSAGFTSVYILAHEIGHNLGMHHDGIGNSCPKEGYIMSPSRGTNGETLWSTCSVEVMTKLSWAKCLQDSGKSPKHLNHDRFLDHPGQTYTAKKQCEVLLRDQDAVVSPNQKLSEICYNLQCKTPHRSGFYYAGPALQGTQCGRGKYCSGGYCTEGDLPKPMKEIPGGWSEWEYGHCTSGCLEKSHGFQQKKRFCNNPKPVNTDRGCEGSSVEFGLCNDENICQNNKRSSTVEYASQKCRDFSKLLPELDPKGVGLQSPHEELRVWMGCAIFCKRSDSRIFYTPRLELNDLGISAYFPDGTWCHNQNGINYYCLQHHCLPENFKFTKTSSILKGIGQDVPFSQNAGPWSSISQGVKNYFSLGSDGRPIKTFLTPEEGFPREEDWETHDYIELSEFNKM